jgi:hypothetical protein
MATARSHRNNKVNAGGAATTLGIRYQAQVTAWWAGRILLQTSGIGTEFDLSAIATAERLYCETNDGIDDVRIELSDGSSIFGQCKTSLQRSVNSKSKFAEVFSQFIRETLNLSGAQNERRFVLFYENHNKSLERLRVILNRYRGLPHGTSLTEAGFGDKDTKIIDDLNQLLDSLFSLHDFNNSAVQREMLLRHSYLKCLDMTSLSENYLGIVDSFRRNLLSRPEQVHMVMGELHIISDALMATKGSVARIELRNRLKNIEIDLKDSVVLQPDFRQLDEWTTNQLASAEANCKHVLKLGQHQLLIQRPVVEEMLRLIPGNSFLVVGDAGAGKTGCLISLAKELISKGVRVWYLPVNSQFSSIQDVNAGRKSRH